MIALLKGALAAPVLAACAVGFANQAVADRLPVDTVSVDVAGTTTSTWTFQGACTPACVARVFSSDGWRGTATQVDGRWSMTVYLGDWIKSSYPVDPANCEPDGNSALLTQNWTWDNATLAGAVETVRGDQCGGSPIVEHAPIALTKVER